jgi:hypothetical protein
MLVAVRQALTMVQTLTVAQTQATAATHHQE